MNRTASSPTATSLPKCALRDRSMQWLKRGLKWGLRGTLYFVLLCLLINLVGLIPVNNDFRSSPDGIEILITSNLVHADFVLPIETDIIHWREHFPDDSFIGNTKAATHVAIGWGDREFFIKTRTWADLRMATAIKALLWPSSSCLHVAFHTASSLDKDARSVKISVEQYRQLVEYINASFRRSRSGGKMPIEAAAYGTNDAFFDATGTYHCLNTCNSWVGDGMQTAGIRTGWFTPLPKAVFLYLPE